MAEPGLKKGLHILGLEDGEVRADTAAESGRARPGDHPVNLGVHQGLPAVIKTDPEAAGPDLFHHPSERIQRHQSLSGGEFFLLSPGLTGWAAEVTDGGNIDPEDKGEGG